MLHTHSMGENWATSHTRGKVTHDPKGHPCAKSQNWLTSFQDTLAPKKAVAKTRFPICFNLKQWSF